MKCAVVEQYDQGQAVSKYMVNMAPYHVSLARPHYLEELPKVSGSHESFCERDDILWNMCIPIASCIHWKADEPPKVHPVVSVMWISS